MSIPIFKMVTLGLLPSPLKKAYYRLKGAKIGKRVHFGLFSFIEAETIEIGDDSRIGLLSFISLRKGLKIGKRVNIKTMVAIDTGSLEIDNDTTIMEQVIIAGTLTPRSTIKIGKRVKIFPYAVLNPTREIIIEDDVGVGGSTYIFTHASWKNVLDGFSVTFGPVHIKRGAWLPWRTFVTPNVVIGEDALITPGSVINKSIPDQGVAGGVPAQVVDMKGRHIRKLNNEYRFKLVRNILSEYSEYQRYLGEECEVLHNDETYMIINHEGRSIGVYKSISDGHVPDNDFVISLEEIPESVKKHLNERKKIWFDLLGKQSVLSDDKIADELRKYFSRYGIRFDIIEP